MRRAVYDYRHDHYPNSSGTSNGNLGWGNFVSDCHTNNHPGAHINPETHISRPF